MSDNSLSGKIALETTDFKAGIAAINRDLRVVESGFRAGSAALGDWSNTLDGTKMRAEALNKEIDLQTKKVAALTSEYDKIVQAQGAESRAAQEMQIKLNKANEELGKSQAELKGTEKKLGELETGMNKAGDETGKTTQKFEGFKSAAGGIGAIAGTVVVGLAAVAAAAIAAAVGIGALLVKTANTADDLVDLSAKTGISVTRLQELGYAGGQVGTDLETMTGSLTKLTRSMGDAASNKKGDAAKAFKDLGVSVKDAEGNLRSSEAVFGDAIDALGKIENPAQRDVLAMALFGKSATELNPLIKAGSDEMARLSEEANKMGAVMSEDDVSAAADLADQLDGLKLGLQGVAMTVMSAFMPAFQGIATTAGGYLEQFAGVVKNSNGDVGKMASGFGDIAGQIANQLAGEAPKMVTAGLALLQGLIQGIISMLPVLLPAVIQIINSLVQFIVTAAPMLLQAGFQILMTLVQAIFDNLPTLITAAIQIIVQLANFIASAVPTLIPTIVSVLLSVVQMIIENLPVLITAAIAIIMALIQGLTDAMPILIEMMPTIIVAIVNALMVALPQILAAAIKIIVTLALGLVQSIPLVLIALANLMNQLITSFKANGPKWLALGKSVVEGLWKGIHDNWDTFVKQVAGSMQGLIDKIKKMIGFGSPAKVFIDIGQSMAQGLGIGFDQSMRSVNDKILGSMANLAGAGTNLALSGAVANGTPGVGASDGNIYQLYFQTYDESGLVRTLRRTEMLYGS